MSRLHQSRAEPRTAFARPAAQTLARALVVAWTHPSPRSQMSCAGKAMHVRPDLRQDHFGQAPLDTWDRLQSLEQMLIGTQALGNLCTHPLDGFIQRVNVSELFAQQKAMVRLELPLEGLLQQLAFGTHPAPGELG